MNVALFGGTFDPIHRGHLAVARAARRQLMLEEILFVPSGVPPHKRAGAVTPFRDRHAMVVLATASERPFVPSRLEDPDRVAGATYSIDTVRRLRRALGPSDRLFFLIGADAFLDIATWRGADVLTREVEFVVASRPGFSLAALPERVRDRATLHLLPGVSERISATEVRRAVRSGQRLEDLVDPAVAAYIYGAGLYRANSCAHHRSETRSKIPARNESRPGPVRVTTVRRRASQGRPANKPAGRKRRLPKMSTSDSDDAPTFRRPKVILPVPTPSPEFQHVQAGVPDTQLAREATGLLREFSTPLLFNHSHRVFFWANELGRQTGKKFDAELVFICAAFHDLGLLKKFSSATDRFEVDSANAVRQFLEHHGVPTARIQTAWDAISLHTTPGIAAYKPLEVELLYNGVGLDVLGIGYETFPEDLRTRVVAQYPRVNFKQEIARAFLGGFEHKTPSTEGTCNEDICSQFIRNYERSNFYEQIQNSPFQNS